MSISARPRLMPLLVLIALLISIATAAAQDSSKTLVLNPDSLTFLNVKPGTPMTKTLTIRNRTSSTPILISVGQPDNPLFIVEGIRQFTLAKGETKSVTISFQSSTPGVFTATLPIDNNATDEPSPIEYKLRGEAKPPLVGDSLGLIISPDPVGFGNVRTGTSGTASVVIRNASSAHRYTGTVSTPASPFSIESGSGAFDLSPGQTQIVAIRFSPTTAGFYLDSIAIKASPNDSTRLDTNVRVILAGQGTDGPVAGDSLPLVATPDMIDFGGWAIGSLVERTAVVVNHSQSDTLTGVISTTSSESFVLFSGGDLFKLRPGEARTLVIRFTPSSIGQKLDSIVATYSSQDTAASSRKTTIILRGSGTLSAGVDQAEAAGYALAPNRPNPAAGATAIDLTIARTGQVRLTLYNMRGELAGTLFEGALEAGHQTIGFDAGGLTPGVYLYRMESGGMVLTRRMTVVR